MPIRVQWSRVLIVGTLLTLSSILVVSCAHWPPVGIVEEWEAPARAARVKNPVPTDETSIAAGRVLFRQQCWACHGATGKGDGAAAISLEPRPSDLTLPMMSKHSDGALFWKISEGRAPMPSFAKLLGDDDRWRIVVYMRTLAPLPEGPAVSSEPRDGTMPEHKH